MSRTIIKKWLWKTLNELNLISQLSISQYFFKLTYRLIGTLTI
jgi:hypothetical protein